MPADVSVEGSASEDGAPGSVAGTPARPLVAFSVRRRQTVYRRDRFTWSAFGALTGFGFLNAVLGPALPYLRAVERISYLVGAMHQVAFAVGGGLAGLAAGRVVDGVGRAVAIRCGLVGAALAGLGIGYGNRPALTVAAALVVSLLGTTALVGLWAALADAHQGRRAVALSEGEVWVSAGGITAPLLVGALAGTTLTWRFAFLVGAGMVAAAVLSLAAVPVPPGPAVDPSRTRPDSCAHRLRPAPTLVVVFAVVALEFSLSFWLASYLNDSVGLSRELAVVMVSGLYGANLVGRLLASRLARRTSTQHLLIASIGVALVGLPLLLGANNAALAAVGIALTGAGIGATFPLTCSLHVSTSARSADSALGQVFTIAAAGQVLGPLLVAAIAQNTGLRTGLFTLPALALLAGAAANATRRQNTNQTLASGTPP